MRPLVYVHIPKTAGTSATSALKRTVGTDQVFHAGKPDETEEFRSGRPVARGYRIYSGHMPFSTFAQQLPEALYVATVRNPEARIVSLFKHLSTRPEHDGHERVKSMTLSDFVRDLADDAAAVNLHGQARYLRGGEDRIRLFDVSAVQGLANLAAQHFGHEPVEVPRLNVIDQPVTLSDEDRRIVREVFAEDYSWAARAEAEAPAD